MLTPLMIARGLHIASSILLLAFLSFDQLVIPFRTLPDSHNSSSTEPLSDQQRFLTILWLINFVSLLAWFLLSAAEITDLSAEDILNFTTQTQFGKIALFRVALLALFAASLRGDTAFDRSQAKILFLWSTAGLSLAAIAYMGHSATGLGLSGQFRLVSDVCHLLVSSLWPGGLPFLSRVLFLGLKSGDSRMLTRAFSAARRFSAFSLASVLILATTGIVNTLFVLPGKNSPFSSAYFFLLLAKICLFMVMIGIGARNRTLVHIGQPQNDESLSKVIRQLNQNVNFEIVLGVIILLLVGMLGSMPPPN